MWMGRGVTDGVYPYIGVGMFFSVYRSEFIVDEKVMKEILQNEQVSYSLAPGKPNSPSKTPTFLFVAKKGNKLHGVKFQFPYLAEVHSTYSTIG